MIELSGQEVTAAFAGEPAVTDAVTAGALLRRAREAAGLHVAALAVSLKVPVRKLEALEEDRWDMLPDAVFVRALASSVCRTLKIDPQPVLARLPQTAAPRLIRAGDGINTPFHGPTDSSMPSWLNQLSRPAFLAVFALLLGALVLVLLPSMQLEDKVAAAIGSPSAISPAQPVAVAAPAVESAATGVPPANVAKPLAAVGTPPVQSPMGAASVPVAALPAAKTVARANASRPEPSPAAGTDSATVANEPATPASGIVVFRARRASWVEVTDAKGAVAVRRLLAAGEAAGANGALPLQVIIGRVDATEVQVRGKPFDLRPVARDNVARFEVK
jgi:cytoskeleton protein RodZ